MQNDHRRFKAGDRVSLIDFHRLGTVTEVDSGEQDRKSTNTHYLVKRGSRWDECRRSGPYPEEAALSKLSDARAAVKSGFARLITSSGLWRVEIVRENENGFKVIWRDPPPSPLEQLAECAE